MVLQEYETLHYAEKVPYQDLSKPVSGYYYLPMHGVTKESSTKIKLCVVLDASAKSSSGCSLNDLVHPFTLLYMQSFLSQGTQNSLKYGHFKDA